MMYVWYTLNFLYLHSWSNKTNKQSLTINFESFQKFKVAF